MKFFNHPKKVCMTYFEHMKFSLYLSFQLFKASVCSLCHAIYPDIFTTYSSDMINSLFIEIRNVGCKKNEIINI